MGARREEFAIKESPDGALLTLRVVPRAAKTGFAAGAGEPRLRLAAPPVDGEANAELVRYLARLFGVAKSDIEILAGQKGRSKRVLVRGVAAAEARRVIASALR